MNKLQCFRQAGGRSVWGCLLAAGLLGPSWAFAQSDNPCGMHWQTQKRALGRGNGNNDGGVFYTVQLSDCRSGTVCGNPKIALQHTYPYPARVSVTLEGVSCDGKRTSDFFSTGGKEIPANQDYTQGNYHAFKEVIGVLKVEVVYEKGPDRYRVEYDMRKGITEVYINNRNAAQRAADKAKTEIDKAENDKVATAKKGGGGLGVSLGGGGGSGGSSNSSSGSNNSTGDGGAAKSATASTTASSKGNTASKSSSTSSKSSSSTSTKKSTTTYYPVESEHDRQMRERASAQRATTDEATKTATVAGATVGAGMTGFAMRESDNNDEDDDLSSYLKLTLGLGLQDIPVTQNMTYNAASGSSQRTQKSNSTTTNHLDARLGLLFAVLNDKFVSLRVSPFVSYGINAFNATTSGSHLSYGSGGAVGLGHRLKLLVQGEYAARSGTLLIDNATINIDAAGAADYDYSTLKYGLGAYYGLGGANAFVQASAFRENISFLKGVKASVFSYEAKCSFSILAISVQYSPNYPIAGKLSYPNGYGRDKQTYLSANLYVPLTIFSN